MISCIGFDEHDGRFHLQVHSAPLRGFMRSDAHCLQKDQGRWLLGRLLFRIKNKVLWESCVASDTGRVRPTVGYAMKHEMITFRHSAVVQLSQRPLRCQDYVCPPFARINLPPTCIEGGHTERDEYILGVLSMEFEFRSCLSSLGAPDQPQLPNKHK